MTDSPTAVHPTGTAAHTVVLGIFFQGCTPLDPLCSAQTGSPRVGCGSSPHKTVIGRVEIMSPSLRIGLGLWPGHPITLQQLCGMERITDHPHHPSAMHWP
jgi:hypothetical protein